MIYLANNPYRKNDIYHFGIIGQKWGIRRFQNPDGTLTEAGKRRYTDNPDLVRKEFKKTWVDAYNRAADKSYDAYARLNEQYKNKDLKDPKVYKKYVEDSNKTWKTLYMSELEKSYGEMSDVANMGREWLKNAPFFADLE